MQYPVGTQYTVGTQYAVGMQYAVGVSAKRSTHTVDAVGTQYAVGNGPHHPYLLSPQCELTFLH